SKPQPPGCAVEFFGEPRVGLLLAERRRPPPDHPHSIRSNGKFSRFAIYIREAHSPMSLQIGNLQVVAGTPAQIAFDTTGPAGTTDNVLIQFELNGVNKPATAAAAS